MKKVVLLVSFLMLALPYAASATQVWIGNGPRVRAWDEACPADRVRLSLRQDGLYRVTAAEIAAAGGWEESAVAAAIATTNLDLSCGGAAVAWLADESKEAIYFYGCQTDYFYAPENVYWLKLGNGLAMLEEQCALPQPFVPDSAFTSSLFVPGTNYLSRFLYGTITNTSFITFADTVGLFNCAFGVIVFPRHSASYTVTLPDVAPGLWQGAASVELISHYDAKMTCIEAAISLGGTILGGATWYGEGHITVGLPFSSTNLTDSGKAVLGLTNPLPIDTSLIKDDSIYYCVSYAISYQRLYKARNDELRCSGTAITVTGFSSAAMVALDITVPATPLLMGPLSNAYDSVSDTWSVSFAGQSNRTYFVCAPQECALAPSIRGVRDIEWGAPGVVPQYAILVPPEGWRDDFRAAVQPLADFRNAHGLRTAIIDIESIYNSFSHGLVDPFAIRAFCAAAKPRGLRYLLLVGAGALDYKHQVLSVSSHPSCLIPSMVAGQIFVQANDGMTSALDAAMVDIDGDNLPDIACGRLPTSRTNEIARAVAKTIAYETTRQWQRPYIMVADWEQKGTASYYPLHYAVSRIAAPLNYAMRQAEFVYRHSKEQNVAIREGYLLPALQAGAALFHFFGHTNEHKMGSGDSVLTLTQIAPEMWTIPPVMVAMGCRNNRWHSLTATIPLLPYGLFAADSGFTAGLGPTGNMDAIDCENLGVALYESLRKEGGAWRLGDMMIGGMRKLGQAKPAAAARLLNFSLIGDPALTIGAPSRATIMIIH